MQIEEMLEQLNTVGKRKTDPLIWQSCLFYYGAIMMNKYNFRKQTGSKAIRYFSLVFAPSGIGKDFSMNTVQKMCGLEKYSDSMMKFYDRAIAMLPEQPEEVGEIKRYMPKSPTVGIEGTAEGLYMVAQSQKASGFGSLNIESREFGESITTSSGLLSKLKELRDGTIKAKVIKGDHESEMKGDLNDIVCNFIGLGSKKGATSESQRELKRIATSGLYRRTFIIDSVQMVQKNTAKTDISKLQEYITALNDNFREEFMNRLKIDFFSEKEMELEKGYLDRAEEIDDMLILNAQEDKLNEFAQYDTGSLEIIESLAHIIAFLEWDTSVSVQHLNKAFKFFNDTRETVLDTFKSVHPYKTMYDLLKLKDNMTVSEMAEFEADIPISKAKVADNIALLDELCYRNDEVLIRNEGKVTRFRIQALPKNTLKKLIVSLNMDKKGEKATHFDAHHLDWEQLKRLAVSEKTESFTTSHYDENYRKKDNFIEGQNLIALDIDEKLPLVEAMEIFKPYTYLIYTTKSHQIAKGDKGIEDRYRIILPTKTNYYVTEDQHKRMYENLAEGLDVHNDTQTKNVSRLWYTNPKATVYENEAGLLDVTPYIPDTIKSNNIMPVITDINTQVEEGELGRREAGYIKYFLTNTSEGNRHEMLTKAYYFFRDLGLDPDTKVTRLNAMLANPMKDSDMKFIYSIGRKA